MVSPNHNSDSYSFKWKPNIQNTHEIMVKDEQIINTNIITCPS